MLTIVFLKYSYNLCLIKQNEKKMIFKNEELITKIFVTTLGIVTGLYIILSITL